MKLKRPVIHPESRKWYWIEPCAKDRIGVNLYKKPRPDPATSGLVMVAYEKLVKIPSGSMIFLVEKAHILNHGHLVGYKDLFGIITNHIADFYEVETREDPWPVLLK